MGMVNETKATESKTVARYEEGPGIYWYAVEPWSREKRDYIVEAHLNEVPPQGLLQSEWAARDAKNQLVGHGGARFVRITIHRGSVTTRTVCR